jgi:hypothetical protein
MRLSALEKKNEMAENEQLCRLGFAGIFMMDLTDPEKCNKGTTCHSQFIL